MGSLTPQWLYGALDDALVGIGATADPPTRHAEISRVLAAWNTEGRAFHNARYLATVMERLDELEGAASDTDVLRIALAYRGAQEEVGWEESDLCGTPASVPATVDLHGLIELGVDEDSVDRVRQLIRQLSQHRPDDTDLDGRILVDADLSMLAAPPQQYRRLIAGLKSETSYLDFAEFLKHRRSLVRALLARRNIFFSPIARKWDESARQNLEAEMAGINKHIGHFEELEQLHRTEGKDPVVIRAALAQKLMKTSEQSRHSTAERAAVLEAEAAANDSEAKGDSDIEISSGKDSLNETSTLESVADLIEAVRRKRKQ